jgi:hypothetical protein
MHKAEADAPDETVNRPELQVIHCEEEDAPTKEQITAELQRAVSNKILN